MPKWQATSRILCEGVTKIYSRSYGSIEPDARMRPKITVPPDYNGSMYAEDKKYEPEPPIPEKQEAPKPKHATPSEMPPSEAKPAGLFGGFSGLLEKISAEDLLMFGLLLAMLHGDSGDNLALLTVILAIILT